ncbi:hypothetical protein MSAN_02501600 [Mycena sanguinolenta]|uniref:Uncharacterized protein n=1 Tax=Mycena sanguinolenta TaxID=230812 RepID=A0A8H6U1F2_9AGAR|nr:hypothetical protein MSAN_02501600 [Mycena sanguinolenta]
MMHNSEASENWDDDFEFHSNKGSTRPTSYADQLEENIDQDQDNNHERHAHAPRHRDSHETTENWDDDFAEDDADADASSPSVEAGGPPETNLHRHRDPESDIYPNSIDDTNAHTSSSSGFSLPPPPARDQLSHGHRTPRASKIQRRQQQQRMRAGSGATARQDQWDSSDDEELGFGEEEDRTVTARSRRTLASVSSAAGSSNFTIPNGSPPPPVPPLPGGITPASSIGRSAGIGIIIPGTGGGAAPFPFPRSPTASVFSAPDTHPDNASIAYTHTSAGSTTALNRPRANASTKGAKGLAGLPPSPPIHRERERRRLRKKSRPSKGAGGGGMLEMREMREMGMREVGMVGVGRESSEEAETAEEDWDAEDDVAGGGAGAIYGAGANSSSSSAAYNAPPHGNNVYFHPSTSSTSNNNTPYGAHPAGSSASGSHVVLGSPGAGGGLLSRIGSVKRWAVPGRKKSSSVSVGSVGMGGERFCLFSIFFSFACGEEARFAVGGGAFLGQPCAVTRPPAHVFYLLIVIHLRYLPTQLSDPELDVIQDITAHANGLTNEATPRPPSLLRTGSHSSLTIPL